MGQKGRPTLQTKKEALFVLRLTPEQRKEIAAFVNWLNSLYADTPFRFTVSSFIRWSIYEQMQRIIERAQQQKK